MKAIGLQYDSENPLALAQTDEPGGHEPKRANQALHDYALLGPQRSIERVWQIYERAANTDFQYKSPVKNLGQLKTYSMRYAWKERSKLYDALTQKQREQELNEFWQAARTTIHLRDFEQAEKLRGAVDHAMATLVDFIEEHEETKNGQKIIYKKVNMRNLIEALKLASELQRRAAGLDNKPSIQGNFDLNQLPTPYLDRVIAGEEVVMVWADFINDSVSTKGAPRSNDSKDLT